MTIAVIVLFLKVSAFSEEKQNEEGPVDLSYAVEVDENALSYQEKYPSLYIEGDFAQTEVKSKIVYLTFDDGPSVACTTKILDILKENDIKATFFLVGKITEEKKEIVQRIIDEGHTIGIHSYSHDYETIYQSVDAYLADFEKLWTQLYEEFSYKAEIYRFPGGSVNSYNYTVCHQIIAEMYRRGFVYFDWNASAEDASSRTPSSNTIENRILRGVRRADRSIVLMHDSEKMTNTVEALPRVISELKEDGYSFDKLDRTVKTISFSYLK